MLQAAKSCMASERGETFPVEFKEDRNRRSDRGDDRLPDHDLVETATCLANGDAIAGGGPSGEPTCRRRLMESRNLAGAGMHQIALHTCVRYGAPPQSDESARESPHSEAKRATQLSNC